jgi:hypothetical protein
MLWLKRNLFLVVGILVSLGLLGGAIAYLVMKYGEADSYQTKFMEVKEEFKKYQEMAPTPNKENIGLAEADTKRLETYMAEVKKHFKTPPYTKMDDAAFLSLLQTSIAELVRGATNAAVTIPDKYKFTFTAQIGKTKFPSNSVPLLAMQLSEIKSICNVLYQAKVLAVESIRRAPVSPDDAPPTGPDYIDRKVMTNQFGVVVPYEIAFKCFSAELATVIDAFARTDEFILVKNLVVQGEAPPAPPPQPEMAVAPQPQPKKAVARPVVKTVMDERALRVVMQLDLMRAPPTVAAPGVVPVPAPAPVQPNP